MTNLIQTATAILEILGIQYPTNDELDMALNLAIQYHQFASILVG